MNSDISKVPASVVDHTTNAATGGAERAVDDSEFESRLELAKDLLPTSECAIDVYRSSQSEKADGQRVAALIQRDASLTVEVLRLANSSFYNPAGIAVADLAQAVARIGTRHIGKLALASLGMKTMAAVKLPWLDATLTWHRSIAAGVAMEFLIDEGRHQRCEDGLVLCAVMHSLGRVLLGSVYPEKYETMLARCNESLTSLADEERDTFPEDHARIMARLLKEWKISPAISSPLKHLLDDYGSLARLADASMRTKAALLKVAVLVGKLAVGKWENWDRVEFPENAALERLGIRCLARIVERTRQDTVKIVSLRHSGAAPTECSALPNVTVDRVPYRDLSGGGFDFVAAILPSMAIEPKNADLLDRGHEKTTVVNCIGASPTRLAREFDARSRERLLAVTDARGSEAFGYLAPVVTLPNSYGLLKHTFLLAARQSPDARASANDEMPALNHNGLNCRKCPSRVRNGMSERIVAEHKGPGEIF